MVPYIKMRKAGSLMTYGLITLEKRVRDNIKNYNLQTLIDLKLLRQQAENLFQLFHMDILITDRHGEREVCVGEFETFQPDVVKEPGRKVRVAGRTVAHVYEGYDRVEASVVDTVKNLFHNMIFMVEKSAELTYYEKETSLYIVDLEEKVEKKTYQAKHGEKLDALTEVFNHTYFKNRLTIVDRSQVAPVGVICVNINDWKFVNDHYGDEESDRLIKIIASILREHAKPEYVIGRVDGDVFHILIPMPSDMECETYCSMVKASCEAYEDKRLAPSVAIGMVMKENVEESLSDLLSDAEYEMFEDKFIMKNAKGYRERLEKGIHL